MTLKFAGVGIPLATPDLEDRLAAIHPQASFTTVDLWNFLGFGSERLPTPNLPTFPPVKPGVLNWPVGAVRPAFFYAVVNSKRLDDINEAVGNPQTPKPLVMTDGRSGKTISASMYLLPARPLNQLGHNLTDGWLLTLTDARFFWQWKFCDITRHDSWAHLFTDLANALGIAIESDIIDSAYTPPTEKWLGHHRVTATVLDAAAAQVGMRFVPRLDGTYRMVSWQTAKASSDAYMADRHVISGGLLSIPEDIGRAVPSRVSVYFASGGGGCCAPAPYVLGRALTGLVEASALYAPSPGFSDASGTVYADGIYDGTNATALGAYADAAATAWYGWRAPDVDVVFPGVEPWVMTGWEDFAEWTYQVREGGPYASTMVRRGSFDALPSGSWEVGDCCEFFVEITGGTDSGGYSGNRVVLLGPNNWVAATAPEPLEFDGNIWRAKSNQVAPIVPPIGAGQVVRVWRSPTYGPVGGIPQYECLPWGSQNKVTVLSPNCASIDVWGRDLYSEPTTPSPPPVVVTGHTTTSPGAGVVWTGTVTRFLTRYVTGGTGPYTTVVNFGDGFQATGADVTHTYATGGFYQPYAQYFDSATGFSDPTPVLGGDGRGVFVVLDDPGLAVTLLVYRLTTDFPTTSTTLAPVTALAALVSGGLEYKFEFNGRISPDATGGVKIGIGGTCTATEVWWQNVPNSDAARLEAANDPHIALGGTDDGPGGATDYEVYIRGSIKVDQPGTLYPIVALKTASGTTTVKKDSTFTVTLTQPHS